jgi:hypothetical protein
MLSTTQRLLMSLSCAAALAADGRACAATLTLHRTAIDTALSKQVFTQDGKYVLSGSLQSCSVAYLEQPRSSLRAGRFYLSAHFLGRVAQLIGGRCVGGDDAFDVTVSARPYFKAAVVGLEDVRLEQGKEAYRPLLEVLMTQAIPRALTVDLQQEITKLLQSASAPYQITVPALVVQSVNAGDDVLKVQLDAEFDVR